VGPNNYGIRRGPDTPTGKETFEEDIVLANLKYRHLSMYLYTARALGGPCGSRASQGLKTVWDASRPSPSSLTPFSLFLPFGRRHPQVA